MIKMLRIPLDACNEAVIDKINDIVDAINDLEDKIDKLDAKL